MYAERIGSAIVIVCDFDCRHCVKFDRLTCVRCERSFAMCAAEYVIGAVTVLPAISSRAKHGGTKLMLSTRYVIEYMGSCLERLYTTTHYGWVKVER
jgi:hypothetical protein